MAKPQRGLGRGLDALLGGASTDLSSFRRPVQYINTPATSEKENKGGIMVLDINTIEPNPYQPRVTWNETALAELSSSIKTLGLIQPITVREVGEGHYQIISGERRFRASKLAGLTTIPAYVRSADDTGMLEMAIVENVQRYDLDPIETAMSFQRLIDECHLTQEKMAERIGKSRVVVTNFLRLLKLPAKVQYDVKVGNISVGHAKVLLGLEDGAQQERLCDEIISKGLSVRALETLVREIADGKVLQERKSEPKDNAEESIPDQYYTVADVLGKYFGNKVAVKRSADGKGTFTVRFKSDDEVLAFSEALKKHNL